MGVFQQNRATADMAPGPEWLAVDTLLSAFGQRRAQAVAAYRAFVAAGKNQPSPWAKLKNQIYLGSDAFVNNMQRKVNSAQDLSEVPAARRRQMAKPLEYYARKYAVRDEAIAQAYAGGGYGMKEIGAHFGLHYSRVSRIIGGRGKAKGNA